MTPDTLNDPLACSCGLKACGAMFSKLTPGTRAFISVSGLKGKVECSVLGFKKNQFIILSVPGSASAASPDLLSLLYNGNIVTLFLVIEGKIAVLESHVVRFHHGPGPHPVRQLPHGLLHREPAAVLAHKVHVPRDHHHRVNDGWTG